ncbi:MAG: hypothetical protein LUC39_03095 [Clostridiales bacterium]|nr:hypothetical protein [Clostridiales bacterium]
MQFTDIVSMDGTHREVSAGREKPLKNRHRKRPEPDRPEGLSGSGLKERERKEKERKEVEC